MRKVCGEITARSCALLAVCPAATRPTANALMDVGPAGWAATANQVRVIAAVIVLPCCYRISLVLSYFSAVTVLQGDLLFRTFSSLKLDIIGEGSCQSQAVDTAIVPGLDWYRL